ncbi:MAG: nitrous oxide reductase family maturation protein NosD [Promethearchaeota archaeon]
MIFNFFNITRIPLNYKTDNYTFPPKLSYQWIITKEIHINNNWSASEALYDFITGSGTFDDPYILENITITNRRDGSDGIIVQNSMDYFIIRNCRLKSSGTLLNNSEVKLVNSTRGILINNTISSNVGYGISLINSYNNSIIENSMFNNTYIGIGLNKSHNNVIIYNRANNHGKDVKQGFGIVLFNSDNNSISKNIASYNTAIGILLYNSSFNNITLNTANNNYLGLHLGQSSNYNNIIGNNLKGNNYCYTVDTEAEGNIFEDNDCGSVGFEFYFFLIAFGSVFALSLIGAIFAIRRRRKIKKERKKYK